MNTIPAAGIDVSKRFSDLCILSPDNQVFSATRIYHDQTSMDRAIGILRQAENSFSQSPIIVMESTSHYHLVLHQYLASAGFEVLVINPLQSHALRNVNVRKIKNDKVDAKRLALLYRTAVLRPSQIPQDVIRGLRLLCRQRSDLMRDSTRYTNHLIALLDQIFPGYDRVFAKVSSKGSLAVLEACPSPQDALYMELPKLAEIISEASHKGMAYGLRKAEKIQEAARNANMIGISSSGDAAIISSTVAMLTALKNNLGLLEDEIKRLITDEINISKLYSFNKQNCYSWITIYLVSVVGE